MKKSSRILAFVLTLLMVVSLMPVSALADELAPASAAESLLLPGMVDIPAIEETEEPVATETPAPTEAPAETEQPEATEAPVLPELDVVLPEVGSAADAVIGEAAETEEEAPVEDVEEAAEDGATTLLAEAVFASDVHASTSAVSGVFSAIESDYSGNIISGAGFVGDTAGDGANGGGDSSYTDPADITSAVKTALDDQTVTCVYSYGSHDKGYVTDMTGELYENTFYYVYAISQNDMSSSTSAASAVSEFNTWVESTDKTKPIFILSHQPLHSRRNDNGGAGTWYTAIKAAALNRDITFFWGHNHTGENSVDTAAYYVAKNGTETMDIYNGDSGVTPNFTYMNAGYIGKTGVGRAGVATMVSINSDTLVFQDYNSSGTYTGDYNHNVTVERSNTVTTEKTLDDITIITQPNKVMYLCGDTFDATGMVVSAIYTDSSYETVTDYTVSGYDMSNPGKQTVTVTYGGKTATFDIIVAAMIDHSDVSIYEDNSYTDLVNGTYSIRRSWTCYLSAVATAALDWEITENDDGTYTVSRVDSLADSGVTVTGGESDGYITLTSVDTAYATEGYETATKTYLLDTYNQTFEEGEYEELTLDSLDVTGTDTYTVGDELSLTIKGLIYSTEGSTTVDVEQKNCTIEPSCSCGATTVDELMNIVATGEDGTYHQVTVKYGGAEKTFNFTVGEAVAHSFEDTGIIVSVSDFVSASGTVVAHADTTDLTIPATIENPVAYDITPGEGYALNPGNYAEITFPIPDGYANPVVYCVDTEEWFEDIDDVADTYTVRTSHFSTWTIGETTVIEVPDPETATGSGTTTTTEKKTVYVLTSSISSGNDYLIVNGNSAGSYYALANNNGSVAATGVKVKTDSEIGTYIELDDATDELWTVSNSYRFQNNGYYLRYNNGLGLSTSNYTTWSYSNNRLSYRSGSTTYYLRYNSGWTWTSSNSASGRSVYFYVPTEVEVETSVTMEGTYSIEGEDISVAVSENSTANLTSTLIFTPESGTATTEDVSTAATYEIVTVDKEDNTVDGDPNDIISKIENGVVTFTGNYGTALVKVSYTIGSGVVTDYITIEAKAPYYTIDLHYADLTEVEDGATFDENATYYIYNDTTNVYEKVEITEFEDGVTYYTTPLVVGEEITSTVALKGIEAGDKYPVWAVIKEHNAESPDGEDLGDVEDDSILWTVSNTAIATIDPATGVLTFTGENYGTFTVTVSYEGADGKVITDTITISATESLYIVPGDGTNDFPEYPNEGAVRFDKTATAVGNYSETGIAMVELSMTGVNYNKGSEIDVVVMLDMSTSMDDDRIAATVAATKTFIDSIVKNEDGSYNANRVYVGYFNGDTVYTITDSGNIGGELASVDNDTEYNALIAAIEDEYDGALTASGTNYDVSLEKCYNVLTAAKTDGTGNDRQQFVVFMSDGGPTDYATSASNVVSESTIVDWFSVSASDSANWTNSMVAEYWSGLMKTNGVTIYSVGLLLNEQPTSGPQDYRDYSADQNYYVTSTLLTGIASGADYFINCESATDTTEMEGIFDNIAKQILQAATNVVVEDKIGSNYTVNFSIPGYGTDYAVTDALEGTTEFYIQVVEYTLDENNDRSGDPEVLENFTFNADGTLKSHTVDGVVCSGCSHVTITNGVVTAIDGTYFDYKSDSTGEYLTWKTAELTDTELALQYFAYLDNSTGVSADEQIKAGTYYTNEYATLTYTNYNGNQVQQKFPVPQMTWNGAQVSYTFYLVNDAGQPVNRAGRVVPFAEAVYVTEVFTYSIVWNDLEQSAGLDAEYLAQNLVPDVYALYDDDATYNIHVYEDEDKSNLNNHFVIGGNVTDDYNAVDNSWTNASTTYVFNNKSDAEKYHTVGAYIANDGKDGTTTTTYLCKGEGTVSGVQFSEAPVTNETELLNGVYYTLVDGIYTRAITYAADTIYYNLTAASYTAAGGETQWQPGSGDSTTGGTVIGNYIYYVDENGDVYTIVQKTDGTEVREGFDFSNTTVAFAVVWKPELRPDTVVIDYGLPVDIDVIATDSMAAGVVGVRDAAPSGVNEDGTYTRDEDATLTEVDLTHGSARVKNNTVVTYTPNTMTMSAPEVFYYEADVNFYDKDNEFQSTSMYSSVTVVPATTIYYEDSFVTFNNGSGGSTGTWSAETTQSGTQALDRPGPDKYGMMNGMYQDADNVYGYDSTYDDMATYSMGSARYVTVSAANNPNNGGTWPTAEFTFTGTGFDIISMTDNTTGTIFVDVYAGTDTTGDVAYNWVVDTYYGYARELSSENPWLKHTWTYYAGGWHVSTEEVKEKGEDGDGALPESPVVGDTCVMYEANYIWTVVDNKDPNALYQVPVIKSAELPYETYTVVITPKYAGFFDHTGDQEYNFYLDAIRIYNPAGPGSAVVDSDTTIADIYEQDGEFAPEYFELRNWVLEAKEVTSLTENPTTTLKGIAFIDTIFVDAADEDGAGEVKLVADYNEVGPNNELYLTCGNAIAFNLEASKDGCAVQSIQLGMKSVGGDAVVKVYDPTATVSADATAQTLSTATDMYYDITDLNGKIVVIENAGTEENAILSITNIKVTYVEAGEAVQEGTPLNLDGFRFGAVALTGSGLSETAEVAAEEDEVILNGAAGDNATEESVFTVTAQTVEAAIKALRNEVVETPKADNAGDETPGTDDNTDSGGEDTPGDEETGGDAGEDDNTGNESTGDEETDDGLESAVNLLVDKVKTVIQTIKNILSGLLGRLGR